MSAAANELQQTVFKALLQDTNLATALGDGNVYDRMPERAKFPYIVMGRSTVSDWSTSTEDGETIVFFIHIWSKANDREECNTLQDHIRRVLTGTLQPLAGHVLINLRFQFGETRRDHERGHVHAVMRFSAVIEPSS